MGACLRVSIWLAGFDRFLEKSLIGFYSFLGGIGQVSGGGFFGFNGFWRLGRL